MAEIASFGVDVDENTKLAQNAQDTANKAGTGVGDLNDPNKLAPAEKAGMVPIFRIGIWVVIRVEIFNSRTNIISRVISIGNLSGDCIRTKRCGTVNVSDPNYL